ncbi:MAG: Hpt domain-containing protein [Magnetococcales bacterium]|nr:Hpt domain-containing protein [Magnetococcales bacterium]
METVSTYQELLDVQKLSEMKQELGDGFTTVVRHYQAGVLHRPERIRQAIRDQDAERVAMESHSLKSVCRQVGLARMGDMAAELESLGTAGNFEQAESLVERLIAASVTANQELTCHCAGIDLPRPFFEKGGRVSSP